MLRIREAIVVEGKYDKIRLESVVDGLIIETNGFGIFRDREQMALLRRLAAERGLVVLTDSDAAGFVIRDHLAGSIPPEQVKHAFIPEIRGKERRKAAPSKEGLLGVEGMDSAALREAAVRGGAPLRSGAAAPSGGDGAIPSDEDGTVPSNEDGTLTRLDLYEAGLTGGPDSAARRERMLEKLGLPRRLSTSRLLAVLGSSLSRKELFRLAGEPPEEAATSDRTESVDV